MKLIEHFIDGKIYSGNSKRKSKVFDPATGKQSAEVTLATKEDVNKAVENAKNAFVELVRPEKSFVLLNNRVFYTKHRILGPKTGSTGGPAPWGNMAAASAPGPGSLLY